MTNHPRRRKDYRRPGGRFAGQAVPPGWRAVPGLPGVHVAPEGTPPPGSGGEVAQYRHAEAFCLMTYRADDGSEEEVVWNSRDGVTPFVITLRSGKQAKHVDWQSDQRVPDFRPPPGSRIFVDLTPERARELAQANAERWWHDPSPLGREARSRWKSPKDMARSIARDYRPGAPDLIEVAGAPTAAPDRALDRIPGRDA